MLRLFYNFRILSNFIGKVLIEWKTIMQIKQIIYSKTVKNGMWLYLLQIFNTLVPLLTIPYITRILDKSQYGVFSIALNLIGYFQVVIEYGFGMSATRKVALLGRDKNKLYILFTSIFGSRIFLFILSGFFGLFYAIAFNLSIEEKICIAILFLSLVGVCFQTDWLFQGLQEMQYISIINITGRTISVILTFFLVKSTKDIYLYCLLYSLSPLIGGLSGFIIAILKFKLRIIKINLCNVVDEIKDGWYVFTTQLSSKVFGAIGLTFLGMYGTTEDVGVFSAIQKIPNVIMLAWSPVSQIIYPLVSKNFRESFIHGEKFVKKIQYIAVPIFIVVSISIIILAKPIVTIAFGESYNKFYYWIIPLQVWTVIAINNNFLGIQILLGSGHDREYSRCFQIGVICTVILNCLFVYLFKGIGASFAPLASEIILTFLLYNKIRIIKNNTVFER